MAIEITQAGYATLRAFVEQSWKYVELRNAEGQVVTRMSIEDPRVNWIHTAGAQTMVLQIVIEGEAVGVANSVGSCYLYDVPSGGEPLGGDVFVPFTFEELEDTVKITVELSIPRID